MKRRREPHLDQMTDWQVICSVCPQWIKDILQLAIWTLFLAAIALVLWIAYDTATGGIKHLVEQQHSQP